MIKFFKKHFWVLLVIVVIISYGSILWMQPWQDDNALFFKLAHIEEAVGFIGKGPFGEGAYKYAVTPFIPVYKIFGYFMPAYFGLALFFYIITTLVTYKSIGFILGKKAGRMAGFIFACGYVVSDGVWRLANSVTTSISIIIANLVLISYWKFYKQRRLRWYFLGLLTFWAGLEFEVSRMHYFIAVVIFFELIFLAFRRPLLKSILFSILRLLPFLLLFKIKVLGTDARSAGAGNLVLELFKGKFDSFNGFISSLTNLILPDWLTKRGNLIFLGFIMLIIGLVIFLRMKGERKRLYLFFCLWLLANLYAYASYLPNIVFGSTDRYLAHSFYALLGIFSILYVSLDQKRMIGKIVTVLLILLGIGNLINVITAENNILLTRSFPVKHFYEDLKTNMPVLKKGDLLYIDVSADHQQAYADAISAAMMPNSGSFAWRYGEIDRYDFSLINDFNELSQIYANGSVKPEQIHSFWYSSNGLVETSKDLRDYFSNKVHFQGNLSLNKSSKVELNFLETGTNWLQPELIINLEKPIKSSTPNMITFAIKASPLFLGNVKFPLYIGNIIASIDSPWRNKLQRNLALDYQKEMKIFLANLVFEVSSVWQNNFGKNLFDNDPSTFWQSERVIWQNHDAYIKVKLPQFQSVVGIIWMNATYSGSIPTAYEIAVSDNGVNWKIVKKVAGLTISPGQNYHVESFDPIIARFVKIKITDTFGGDSPMISEFRVIPENLSQLDIAGAENFLSNPFLYTGDSTSFRETISSFNGKGKAQIYWTRKDEGIWLTSKDSNVDIRYDGMQHIYKVKLPAGGFIIDKVKLSDIKIPGNLILTNIDYSGINFSQDH